MKWIKYKITTVPNVFDGVRDGLSDKYKVYDEMAESKWALGCH